LGFEPFEVLLVDLVEEVDGLEFEEELSSEGFGLEGLIGQTL